MLRYQNRPVRFAILLMLACLAIPTHAGDGRFELNHEAALKGIPAIGDSTPGYPITISQPGSYILTGDLVQPGSATNVIEITADDVDIDLNGFAIRGSNSCTRVPASGYLTDVDCSLNNGAEAITATGQSRISIHGGSIHGIAGKGIEITDGNIYNMQISEIGDSCLTAYGSVSIRDVRAELCNWHGIDIESGSVESSLVLNASANGINVSGSDSLILHSVTYHCGNYGISLYSGNSVLESVASSNSTGGIKAGGGSSIVGCNIRDNNGHGLYSVDFSTIAYSGNVIMSNSSGTIGGVSTWVEFGQNICSGNTTCP